MMSLNQEMGHPKSILISVICVVLEVPRKLVKSNQQILLYTERNLMDRVQPLGIIPSYYSKEKEKFNNGTLKTSIILRHLIQKS